MALPFHCLDCIVPVKHCCAFEPSDYCAVDGFGAAFFFLGAGFAGGGGGGGGGTAAAFNCVTCACRSRMVLSCASMVPRT